MSPVTSRKKLYHQFNPFPVNHFMFCNLSQRKNFKNWVQPVNDAVSMTLAEWLEHSLERNALVLSYGDLKKQVETMRERRLERGVTCHVTWLLCWSEKDITILDIPINARISTCSPGVIHQEDMHLLIGVILQIGSPIQNSETHFTQKLSWKLATWCICPQHSFIT